jgi:hypothetical protein
VRDVTPVLDFMNDAAQDLLPFPDGLLGDDDGAAASPAERTVRQRRRSGRVDGVAGVRMRRGDQET